MTVGSPGHICVSGGVNNKGRPSQPSPLSQRAIDRDGCDDGDVQRLLLWPAHAYMPQAKGVLPGDIPIRGARAQHCATVWPGNKVCRVCGSHPAAWASGRKPTHCGPVRDGCNAEGVNLCAYPVCKFAARLNEKRPGTKTQCWCGVAADLPPGLHKSAHQRCEHRLTHRTQVVVTFREARTRARV